MACVNTNEVLVSFERIDGVGVEDDPWSLLHSGIHVKCCQAAGAEKLHFLQSSFASIAWFKDRPSMRSLLKDRISKGISKEQV